MRLWSGRGSQQNSDLSDPKRRGAQNDEARIALQHFYNETKDFNFRQNNLNRFPAPLVHNGGSTKAAFFPIQAKQHWYYMACPDYMMTNNSPLNVFPFLLSIMVTFKIGKYLSGLFFHISKPPFYLFF